MQARRVVRLPAVSVPVWFACLFVCVFRNQCDDCHHHKQRYVPSLPIVALVAKVCRHHHHRQHHHLVAIAIIAIIAIAHRCA